MTRNNRPNILFVMTDQLRADGVGESSFCKTPHIDNIAASGTTFSSCYANAPVCIPSRFSLATGHSVTSLGIYNNFRVDLNPNLDYWTNKVKNAGYQTAVIGKTHLHRHNGDLRDRQHLLHSYGFDFVEEVAGPRACMKVQTNMTDLWQSKGFLQKYIEDYEDRFANKPFVARPSVLPNELYADNYVGNAALDYLQTVELESPWFCWVSFAGPHEPWDAPQEYCSKYDNEQAPTAIAYDQKQMDLLPKDSLHHNKHQQAPSINTEEVAAMRVNYAANVSLIDERIGDIIDVLKKRDCLDNTLIVFTSDHGEMNGDHGLIYKNVLYEQAIKVPLIVKLPTSVAQHSKKTQNTALVQMADIGPTILDFLEIDGIDSNKQYAQSFFGLLTKDKSQHRDVVFSEVAGDIMVTDGKWKMIANDKLKPYMLFNLLADPKEQHNRIKDKLTWLVKRRLLGEITQYIERETAIDFCRV